MDVVLRTCTPEGTAVVLSAIVYAKILEEHAAVADLDLIDRTIREPDERRPDPRVGRERFFRREGDVWVLAVVDFLGVPATPCRWRPRRPAWRLLGYPLSADGAARTLAAPGAHNEPLLKSREDLEHIVGGLRQEAVQPEQHVGVDGNNRLAQGDIQLIVSRDSISHELVVVEPRHDVGCRTRWGLCAAGR
jgi:hypothetical protein